MLISMIEIDIDIKVEIDKDSSTVLEIDIEINKGCLTMSISCKISNILMNIFMNRSGPQ